VEVARAAIRCSHHINQIIAIELPIDVLETGDGRLLLNEINHTMEFRNSSAPTGVDIPAEVAAFVLAQASVPV